MFLVLFVPCSSVPHVSSLMARNAYLYILKQILMDDNSKSYIYLNILEQILMDVDGKSYMSKYTYIYSYECPKRKN